ncbi:hypothetical protein [Paenibacillus sp. sgz500958]|uniref:hypothetical protein n=1 Tax=Paenibacillus sp. sgz500958 TaxID=3242475 RepID=UPI0036D32193
MLSNLIKRLSPQHKKREKALAQASGRVTVAIRLYQDMSQEIQEEIDRNKFARYLLYDRGNPHVH